MSSFPLRPAPFLCVASTLTWLFSRRGSAPRERVSRRIAAVELPLFIPRCSSRGSLYSLLAFLLALIAGAGCAQAQSTLTVALGSTSAVQSVNVYLTGGGTLSTFVLNTEGVSNGEFAFSSSSCTVGKSYSAGTVCQVSYTFTPQYAGLRRGGIILENSAGNPLGETFIKGFGTGSQSVFYPVFPVDFTNSSPQIATVTGDGSGDFAIDGAENIYFWNNYTGNAGGEQIIKATRNYDGSYTQNNIYSGTFDITGGDVAVDGIGNVYFANGDSIVKLTLTNNGYSASKIASGYAYDEFIGSIATDGQGAVYAYDDASGHSTIAKFTPNGTGGYTQTWVSPDPTEVEVTLPNGSLSIPGANESGVNDMQIDSSGNVWVVAAPNLFYDWAYNAANGTYSYNFLTLNIDYSDTQVVFSQQDMASIVPEADGGFLMDDFPWIYRLVPNGSSYEPQLLYFNTVQSDGGFGILRESSQGSLFMESLISTDYDSPLTATFYRQGASPYDTLNFGTLQSGTGPSATQSVQLTNIGSSTATGGIAFDGHYSIETPANDPNLNENGFYIDLPPLVECGSTFSLAGQGYCAFGLAFTPASSDSGTEIGQLVFYDTNNNTLPTSEELELTGTAQHPLPTVTSLSPSSGTFEGGTTFVITGTALGDVSSITFDSCYGTINANYTINSPTQITAASTLGCPSGIANIIISNPGGSTTAGWTYNPSAAAADSTLTIAASSIIEDGTTTLTATAKTSNGTPLAGDIITFTSSNPAVASAPSAWTNSSGVATSTVTGLYPGTTTFKAQDGVTAFTQTPSLTVTDAGVTVGQSLTGQTALVTFSVAGTLYSTLALTGGASNTDFTATANTCAAGTAYSAGATCTITYTFSPTAPGLRLGAIVLKNISGAELGTTYLSGIGFAPLAEVFPGIATTLGSNLDGASDVATDGLGNLYYAASTTGVSKIANGTTTLLVNTPAEGLAIDGAGNILYSSGQSVSELVIATGALNTIATFNSPATPQGHMAFDGAGNLYVALGTAGVGKIAPGTLAVTTIAGPSGTSFNSVAADSGGNLFLSDNALGAIYEIPSGSTSASIVASGLTGANGVAVDAADNLYVGKTGGVVRLAAGTYAATTLYSGFAENLSIDRNGTLWVASIYTVNELNRTAGQTLSFIADTGVQAQQSMTLENDGNAPLQVSAMAVSSPFTADGSSSCSASILLTTANPICSLVIDFTPTISGTFSGTATLTDNSLFHSAATQSTPLSATAYGTQTITFPQPTTPELPEASTTLTATASSGLAVTYAITSGPATISGSTVTYTGTGTVVITASQPGNANFAAATPVSVTVVVGGLSEPVGTTSPTESALITITKAGTLQTINVLTMGAANKDYAYVSGSNASNACTIGIAYAANATCTVTYSFAPIHPGLRQGAISLTSSASTVMGTQLLTGTGTGAEATFPGSTAISTLVTGSTHPTSVAVDGNGDVFYVDDSVLNNEFILKEIVAVNGVVSPSSQVVPVASGFRSPRYVAIDGAGNLFVTDGFGNSSNEVNPGTVTEVVAVNGQVSLNSTLTIVCEGLQNPQGVAVDGSGDVFVSDSENNVVKEVVAVNGVVSTSSVVNEITGVVSAPQGVAVDGSGDVFVAVPDYASVWEIVAVNGLVSSNSTVINVGSGYFNPYDVRVDAAGNVFVADPGSMAPSTYGQHATLKEVVAVNGVVSPSSTVLTLSTAFLAWGLAIDGEGHVFVADESNGEIQELDMTTAPTLAYGSATVGTVSAAQTTTLENVGNSPLRITTLEPSSVDFVLDANTNTCSAGSPLAESGICTVGVDFTPARSGAQTGTINIADNAPSSPQQVSLTGTGTTGTTTQTITFPQPATPVANGAAPVSLTASASSNLAITYSVVSGPATVSGSTLTYTGPGTVVVEADQFGNATYAAATPVQRTIAVVAVVSYTAPSTAVNTTSATQTATVNFTAAGTLSAIDVLTGGLTNLDFKEVTGGTCADGTAYTVGQTCTVEYSFTPAAPGARMGAVVLYSNANTPVLMGTSYLSGTGTGPLALFTNGVQSPTVSGLNFGTAVTVDEAGDIYYAEQTSGKISEIAAGSITPTVITSGINVVTGLVVDGAGNLFYGSYGDNKVYELVGASGSPKFVANVNSPDVSMAVDGAGNIYVPGSDLVTKIAADTFAVSTFGSVTGSVPGVTVDANGNVYFSDFNNNTIYEVAAGSTTPVALVTNGLSGPRGLAVDAAGNLYVANQNSANIVKLTAGTWAPTVIAAGYGYDSLMMDQYGTLRSGAHSAIVSVARSSTTLAFPSTVLGNSANSTVSLENDGNAALTISALGASGTSFTQNSGTTTCNTTTALAVAGTCNAGATFTPQSASAFTGDINVTDNALNLTGSSQQAALTGTGNAATPTFGTMSFSPASATYGSELNDYINDSLSYTGVPVPTGVVTFTLNDVTYSATCTGTSSPLSCTAEVPAATIAALTIQSYTVTAAYASDSNYNATPGASGTLTITKATPTFGTMSASPASATFGTNQIVTISDSLSYAGAIAPTGAVTFTLNGASYTATCTGATSPLSCTYAVPAATIAALTPQGYTLSAAYTADTNYNATPGANGTFTINQISQTISFGTLPNVTYGVTPITLAATASSGLAVSYTVSGPATVSGSTLTVTGAGPVTVTANQAGNTDYSAATSAQQGFMVAKAPLTITANNASMQYGQSIPGFSYTPSGFVNGDSAAVLSGTPSESTAATSSSAPGSYSITITQGTLAAANYTFAFATGTLTVNPASQTISFGALPNMTYGVAPIALTATASSGLPVSYTVTGPAMVSGSTLTVTGAGNVTVTANQTGNADYNAASAQQSFTVFKAPLTITATNASIDDGQSIPSFSYAPSGFVNGDSAAVLSGTPSESTTATSSSAPGSYAITITQATLEATNYAFTFINGTLTINPTTLITFSPAGGTFSSPQQVSILDSESGATIHYTTDGTTPTISSAVFNSANPISVSADTTIKAFAVLSGLKNSNKTSAVYILKVAEPTYSLKAGTYLTPQSVSISDATPSAVVWYTTDDSAPVPGEGTAVQFNGTPIAINQNTTVKAVAAVTEWTTSNEAPATYLLKVADPTFSIKSGTYLAPQQVSISDTAAGAVIWYTTDDSIPVPGEGTAVQFTGTPIAVNQDTTVRAVAALTNFSTSSIATATYKLEVAEPAFSIKPGTYLTPQSINISDTASNSTIWYTTDGTTPVPGEGTTVEYGGSPITISSTTTLKAIAAFTGWTTSSMATGAYIIP